MIIHQTNKKKQSFIDKTNAHKTVFIEIVLSIFMKIKQEKKKKSIKRNEYNMFSLVSFDSICVGT